ncbi:hypothetical protein NDK43_05575 [Neobacillus pocheonensis]|uniref:Spore coat protein n=1 Tax=Neobacillus pocheonensis TaxID=363869 RepID=A0ABT0W6K5_9BACI|nr:hypothetical protein [Neobacillus pocheonensis]
MNKDFMKDRVGKVIKIDRGGPESRLGLLMDVNDDHIVLLTEVDGIVYYSTQHIKSVTEYTKEPMQLNIEVHKDLNYKTAVNFKELLDSLKFQWVRINRGGPEKMEGILTDVNDHCVTLVSKEEVVRHSLFHLRNVSYGLIIEKAKDENSQNQRNSEANMDKSKKTRGSQRVVKNVIDESYTKDRSQRIQDLLDQL